MAAYHYVLLSLHLSTSWKPGVELPHINCLSSVYVLFVLRSIMENVVLVSNFPIRQSQCGLLQPYTTRDILVNDLGQFRKGWFHGRCMYPASAQL
jgi:hypothetical protein